MAPKTTQTFEIFSRTRTRMIIFTIYILIYGRQAAYPNQRQLEPEIQEEHSFANILHSKYKSQIRK